MLIPFTNQSQIWCASVHPPFIRLCPKFHPDRFVLSHSSGGKPKFCRFLTLAFCGVAIGGIWKKLNACVQVYKPNSIQRYIKFICIPMPSRRNCAHKFRRSQARGHKRIYDGLTDKQTKLKVLAAGEIRATPNKLGMVIEDLEHVLVISKTFGCPTQSFTAIGTLKFRGKPVSLNL